jgi:hypothetical protein
METNNTIIAGRFVGLLSLLFVAGCSPSTPENDRIEATLKLQIEKEGCLTLTDFKPSPDNKLEEGASTYVFRATIGLLEPSDCYWEGPDRYGFQDPQNFKAHRMAPPEKERRHVVQLVMYFERKSSDWEFVNYKFDGMKRQW